MLNLFHTKRIAGMLLALIIGLMLVGSGTRVTRAAPDTPNIDLPLPNIIVNTTALTDDGADGKCDLWEALQAVFQANYGMSPTYHECTAKVGGMNIIAFSVVGGTITVPAVGPRTDLPFVHGETVILGPITIAGGGASADTHLLRTAPGAKLTVIAVVLKNGHTSGAGPAIYSDNYASVNVIGSFLINNTADDDGGAIYSNGDLNLMGTSFANNKTGNAPGRGGAVYMTGSGSFKSEASTFTANQAASGGAIYLEKSGGESSISESIFTGNNVSADADGFGGGAVYNASTGGTLEINRTAFNANFSTQGVGGAIVNKVSASTFISNTLFDANVAGDSGHSRNGGAIYNQGPLSIVKSTLVANVADGGSGGGLMTESNGAVTIGNSTFFGNLSDAQGGALYGTANASFAIRNSTFSANIAGSTGDILYLGGNAHASIGNTIFDGSTTPHPNCAGGNPVTSLGHNIDTGTSCNMTASGDMQLTNPLLGSLGFHGGALPVLTTQVPDYASLAIDHGDAAICAHASVGNEDETGSKRPKNGSGVGAGACDIGAVEVDERKPIFDANPMPPGPLNFGSVQVAHTITTSFTVHNAGNYSLTLSTPVIGDGHFAVVTPTFPIGLDVNQVKPIVLSCTPTVTGSLASTFSFHTTDADKPNVSYSLLCNGTAAPAPAFSSLPVPPGPIEFGEVTIGQIVTQTITIKNNGTANLVLNNFHLPDSQDFGTNIGSLSYTIGAGLSVQFSVSCHPSKVGALSGTLIFSTNDAPTLGAAYTFSCFGTAPQSAYLVNSGNLQNPWLPSNFSSLFGIATSPDGLNAYVTGNVPGGGEIVVLKKQTSGILAGSYLWTTQASNALLGNPHEVKVSPDGQYVVAASGSDPYLAEYSRDGNGDLTPIYSPNNIGGLNNPYGVAFSPDSQFVYVTNANGNSISIFKHIGSAFFYTGGISATTMTTHTLQNPTGIVVSPDGKNVYVSVHMNTPSAGTLAVYSRNATTGALTPIQTRYQPGDNQDDPGCFLCFPVNGLASTYQLAISPDGGNVYVTSWYNHAVALFRRDPVKGLLTYQGRFTNSNIGGSGLTNAFGIAVSPDSKHVYVTGNGDNSLVMFDRESVNGYLTFREKYVRDPISGYPALSGVFQTAVSSDGRYVFAVGQFDNAVAIFRIANPVPTLFSLQPASVAQNSAQFTLVVKGSGFVDGAQLWWDGTHPTDTFINSSEMRATIPAAYLTSAGNHTIKIHNPTPGGDDSFNTLTFKVLAAGSPPVPAIDHLNPAGVLAGATGVQVDVYGSNFDASGLTVTANGYGAIHNFIDSTHVRIVSFDVDTFAQPGTVSIQVNNFGVQSNIVGLNVAAPGQNPVPSITALSPDWVWSLGAASSDFTLVITGTNFVDGAVVQWNGSDRPTKFISKTKVQADISGSDQLDPAYNSVIVKNPGPGGGESNVLTLVVRPLHKLMVPLIKR